MDLSTTYLGMKLRTPFVVSASPLSQDLEKIRRMEDAGASAVVLHSLFEEQIRYERYQLHWQLTHSIDSYPEALSYLPEASGFNMRPEEYLRHITRAKSTVAIPIIASLNGSTMGGWLDYAGKMADAGADAIELNLYSIPAEMERSSAEIEDNYLEVVREVRAAVRVPIAVKLTPFFTNLARMAKRLDEMGANALVLFNRFFQPDIEIESKEVQPFVLYSAPVDSRLPLRWIAMLYDRIGANLAATGGIHRGIDAIKMLLAGADVTMVCSVLMCKGIEHIATLEREMRDWMAEHEHESIEALKGSLSQRNCPEPSAFERAAYIATVGSTTTEAADDRTR
jgi:dihydroorotate dehydrogenase (fumarate)